MDSHSCDPLFYWVLYGLKIRVSAVRSRSWPPLFPNTPYSSLGVVFLPPFCTDQSHVLSKPHYTIHPLEVYPRDSIARPKGLSPQKRELKRELLTIIGYFSRKPTPRQGPGSCVSSHLQRSYSAGFRQCKEPTVIS